MTGTPAADPPRGAGPTGTATDPGAEIAGIVAARRERLPAISAEIERWRRADDAVAELQRAISDLCASPATPPVVAAQLGQVAIGAARLSITRAIGLVQRLEARVARTTVCIGVSGAARAGKSTMLQSISGLTDAQMPTGGGGRVTAVPSRLYHTTGRRRAVLFLHTFDTFREAHLRPRYARAGLGEPPADVDAFRAADYAEPGACAGPIGELRAMWRALWSYESLLDRPGRILELTGDELERLPEYVAYPGADPSPAGPARRYLAVREARIEYPFRRAEHAALTLVDLPGLDAEPGPAPGRHVAGLLYDVDVMLVVEPGHAAPTRIPPRCHDLVLVVRNTGAPGGVAVGRDRHPVLEVDGREPADVSARLVGPVLHHLGRRLPTLDETLSAGTRARIRPARDELVGVAAEIKAVLGKVPPMTPRTAEELYRRADELHGRLADALRRLLAGLLDRSARERERWRAAVVGLHAEVVRWVRGGLGVGRERWCADAGRAVTRDGAASVAVAEWTRVRVEIADRYAALDRHLHRRLAQVRADVVAALSPGLGALLGGRSGVAALSHLAELARGASQPCPAWGAAVDALLGVRLDYRTHLHPRVWSEVDPELPGRPAVPDGAAELYELIGHRAEQAAGRTRDRLLAEAALPGEVLCAAVARFTDAVTSTSTGRREIRHLVRAYARQLWPDVAGDLDAADARVARVVRAADGVLAAASGLARPPGSDEPAP